MQVCTENGVTQEFSLSYALQSNGPAEQLMQENWVCTCALMFDTDLPKHFWDEAMHHANWIRNRLPSEAIKTRTLLITFNP